MEENVSKNLVSQEALRPTALGSAVRALTLASDASAGELGRARAAYEDPWDFWNDMRAVSSVLAFIALIGACLLREGLGRRPGGRSR